MGFFNWGIFKKKDKKPVEAAPPPPPSAESKEAIAPPLPPKEEGKRAPEPPAPPPPTVQPAPPPPIVPPAPPPAPEPPQKGIFGRFLDGLAKTRDKVVSGIRSILPFGQRLDDGILNQLEQKLIEADLGLDATKGLLAALREAWKTGEVTTTDEVLPFLKAEIAAYWPADDLSLHYTSSGPTVILVVGVNGSGKTTSIAKLASWLRGQGKTVMVAACDTFRAGAVHQLAIWAERAGVEIVRHKQGADPAAVAFDACQAALARKTDVLLVDTAGRLHTQEHLMRELGKIKNVIGKKIPGGPHETLLVLDATIGQNALQQAKMFSQTTPLTGLFLAKLDGSAKGGIVIAIRNEVNVPVKFVGLGETMNDVEAFDATKFVEGLFG